MSKLEEVVLLGLWVSPFAIRVRVALAEKGIKYESREENLRNKSPLLLEMSPLRKQIPVLIHNGNPIIESLLIVEYIDEIWSGPNLLPSHPYERSHARFWADYVEKKIYPIGGKLWYNGEKTEEEREAIGKELLESFKQLEKELGEKEYFGGQTFGFIDIALIPFYSMFLAFKLLGKLDLEAECPNILQWAKRCTQRESVSKNMPTQQEVYNVVLDIQQVGGKLWYNGEKTEEEKEAIGKELLGSFKQLEEELGEKEYFGGQTFGFIDIALIPFYSNFLAFKLLGNLDLEKLNVPTSYNGLRGASKERVSQRICLLNKSFTMSFSKFNKVTID